MHVLVTGGAGFIGSHLAELHCTRGDSVHVVDDLSTGSLGNFACVQGTNNFRFSEADLLTWDGLETAVAWADRIYHMAAIVGVKRVLANPVNVISTNVAATERLLRAVEEGRWNPRVIIASSSEVYGFNPETSFSEASDVVLRSGGRLRWTYAVTKLADEYLAFSYVRDRSLDIAIARLFNTIGPRQTAKYGMVVPTFVEQAVRNEALTVHGDGKQTRSFCDVRDTVMALDLLAGCRQAKGEVVNVGNEQEISIKDLATLIRERARSSSELVFIPYTQAYGAQFEDVNHRRPVLNKLRELTGFQPSWQLKDTLDELIAAARAAQSRLSSSALN
jgi:UDP-glucose 4-epimerase